METRSPEKRKASARLRTQAQAQTQPQTPSQDIPGDRKPKVRKIHARRPSDARDAAPSRANNSGTSSPAPLTKLKNDSPLPTRQAAEPVSGSTESTLQSIAESGVLAASLAKSRAKWISQGLFEWHWSKPKTVKGVVHEAPKNPPKDSMQKLGRARISIEPHVFDVMLFTIREQVKPAAAPPATPGAAMPAGLPPRPLPDPVRPPPAQHMNNSPAPSTPAPQSQLPTTNQQQATPVTKPGDASATLPPTQTPTLAPVKDAKQPIQAPQPAQQPQPQPQQPQQPQQQRPAADVMIPRPVPGQDPVILMLAQRASTDQTLKVLMKIVASGQASKEQLAVFQGHIDELQGILQRHNQAQARAGAASSAPQTAQRPYPTASQPFNGRPPQPYQQSFGRGGPMSFGSGPAQPKFKAQPAIRFDVVGVCMEFETSTASDRLLFPRQSILEFQPGGLSVKVSFLVIKRGDGSAADFSIGTSYYEPVTMIVSADSQRILEPLTRAVAAPDEAFKFMQKTMSTMTRAPRPELVLQLAGGVQETDTAQDPQTPTVKATPKATASTGRRKRGHDDADKDCVFCLEPLPSDFVQKENVPSACRACDPLVHSIRSFGGLSLQGLAARRPLQAASGARTLLF